MADAMILDLPSKIYFIIFITIGLIEKNEMGGACNTYGGKERPIQDFGGET